MATDKDLYYGHPRIRRTIPVRLPETFDIDRLTAVVRDRVDNMLGEIYEEAFHASGRVDDIPRIYRRVFLDIKDFFHEDEYQKLEITPPILREDMAAIGILPIILDNVIGEYTNTLHGSECIMMEKLQMLTDSRSNTDDEWEVKIFFGLDNLWPSDYGLPILGELGHGRTTQRDPKLVITIVYPVS
jgi:hypothetical protein